MNTRLLIALFLLPTIASNVLAQDRFSTHELSINGFRNPSIGVEYRFHRVSVHAGYYPTNLASGVTTSFVRTGLTYWFLPVGNTEHPSSFYGSLSYARGLDRAYKDKNSFMPEVGFRWAVWRGLNIRLGVAALMARDEPVRVNPTPGVSYSLFF